MGSLVSIHLHSSSMLRYAEDVVVAKIASLQADPLDHQTSQKRRSKNPSFPPHSTLRDRLCPLRRGVTRCRLSSARQTPRSSSRQCISDQVVHRCPIQLEPCPFKLYGFSTHNWDVGFGFWDPRLSLPLCSDSPRGRLAAATGSLNLEHLT